MLGGVGNDTICPVSTKSILNPECVEFYPLEVGSLGNTQEAFHLCGGLTLAPMGISALNPECVPFVPSVAHRQQVVEYETEGWEFGSGNSFY